MSFRIDRRAVVSGAAAAAWTLVRGVAADARPQTFELGKGGGKRFDGIGVVNGGGATSVLLKDYPLPQRRQILDLLYKPKFGASVSALLVEIPGDGNATQGSMPSHMHTRNDLNYRRGYTWWILKEAKARNPKLTLDGTAWSAPGWIGRAGDRFARPEASGDAEFFSQDAIDYYITWLEGLRSVHGLEMDAIGVRNEKGANYAFAKAFRRALNRHGFAGVKLHGFDNWPAGKLDFVKDMRADAELRDALDIISAHTFSNIPVSAEEKAAAAAMGKPIWNTEDHVYKKGFDCAISIVGCFNRNYIDHGSTKIVNWYDIAGVYPIEPYAEDPAALLAHSPWSGHYAVREALWGYAHYGQFSEAGWRYLDGGCGPLAAGGSCVALKAPDGHYSIILETKGAKTAQRVVFRIGRGLRDGLLCCWRSSAEAQFVRIDDVRPDGGTLALTLESDAIYSLSTAGGQQKGQFEDVPAEAPFPFPYRDSFASYAPPRKWGYLPRYTADIAGAFELADRPDGKGTCLRQVVPVPTISWAPDWNPYTILGDAGWSDYEISVEVWLNPGDTAAVMGRICHVGTGYGFIPKGYALEIRDDGRCRLVVLRGKKNPTAPAGDAEQQALIRSKAREEEGGERELGRTVLAGFRPGSWHTLALRFEGSRIAARVDGAAVLTADDGLYAAGMAGLLAGADGTRISTPWFANLCIKAPGAPMPAPSMPAPGQAPLY